MKVKRSTPSKLIEQASTLSFDEVESITSTCMANNSYEYWKAEQEIKNHLRKRGLLCV